MALSHRERRGVCPKCEADNTGHLYQNVDTLAFICFKCGFKGRGELPEVHWLSETEERAAKIPKSKQTIWYETELSRTHHALAVNYLEQHHVPLDIAERNLVGVDGNGLIVPYIDFGYEDQVYRIRYYQTRTLRGVKQWRSFGDRREHLPLFRDERFVKPDFPVLFVVESMISAIRLSTYATSVATCGKTVSMEQVSKLQRIGRNRRVLVWLDADARAEALQLQRMLLDAPRVRCTLIHDETDGNKTDPCDLTDEQVEKIIRTAGIRL